jgi:hypothetical protein
MCHGPKFKALNPQTRQWLNKIHHNLGHPGVNKLQQVLKQQGISTCHELQVPKIARPAVLSEPKDFNDVVGCDLISWTAKSGKKRGGFKLARVLGRDPDNKSMWLQAGTNTVKVSPHQVRPALGFEHWNPSYQDIKALRTAADNLQHGVFQDEQLPQPPEGQELPGFDEVQPQVQVPPPLGVGDDEPEAPGAELIPAGAELIPVPSTPRPVSVPQLPQQQLTEEATQTDPYQQTTINMNMSSPTYIAKPSSRTSPLA